MIVDDLMYIDQIIASKSFSDFAEYVAPYIEMTGFHSTYYDILDKFAHGEIKRLIVTVPPQHGKQISDSVLVPTPKGFVRHGDISVGDYVIGRNGNPVKVLWKSQRTQSEYVVSFSDGSKIECHGNHEWVVYDCYKHKYMTYETKHMYGCRLSTGTPNKRGHKYMYKVDPNICVDLGQQNVSIDPYTLGVWLGDGKSSAPQITIGNNDFEIVDNIPYKHTSHWVQKDTGVDYFYFGAQMRLSDYGLKNNKHIPSEYIFNSVDIRKQLIAGVIDSDGYVYKKNGRVTISNTNKRIIDDLSFILRSLGQNITICKYAAKLSTSGIQGRKPTYQLCFNPTMEFPTVVPRKKIVRLTTNYKRSIISIEKKDGLGWGNCIEVEGGVYLVGETLIPTHNSLGSSILLPAFILGAYPDSKVCIASYAATLANRFNKRVQRIVNDDSYKRVFASRTKDGSNSKGAASYVQTSEEFEIVGRLGSLRSVGREGGLTGNQVDVMIIDDLYKDAMEANSPLIRDNVWEWYTSVVKTRLHNNSQELIVFTRWHEDDLIGHIQEVEQVKELKSFADLSDDYTGWYLLNFEAIKESAPTEIDPRQENEVLWSARHSYKLLSEKRALDPHKFNCMYQGHPSSAEGMLYGAFQTYDSLPLTIKKGNYTDTADMGEDYLCSICYEVGRDGKVYVTDVLFTPDPMEVTESATAAMLNRNDTRTAYVESNNGGRGFARAIQKLAPMCRVEWFNQGSNKEARILSNSATVTGNVIMPSDWRLRWPKFYDNLTTYKRIYRANRWHDAADTVTGIVEREILRRSGRPTVSTICR